MFDSFQNSYSSFSGHREGDITALSVNALVHPTNESFTESSQLSQKVIECAGSKLKEELTTKIKCK